MLVMSIHALYAMIVRNGGYLVFIVELQRSDSYVIEG